MTGGTALWLRRILFRLVAVVIGVILGVALLETGFRLKNARWPLYQVLFVDPDPVVGWKQTPGLEYVWSTQSYECNEFRVAVKVNRLGFRDYERSPAKDDGLVRIALIGDSLVEAIQVSLPETAGQILERKLNERAASSGEPARYEVLNFGVSNYGIGQYLLVYEEYARHFAPDYVFVFAAGFHFTRTTRAEVEGMDRAVRVKVELRIRPTFALAGDELVRHAPPDYEAFVRAHRQAVEQYFGPTRMRELKTASLWAVNPWREPKAWLERSMLYRWVKWRLEHLRRSRGARKTVAPRAFGESNLELNYRILSELNRQVVAAGATLVLVDTSLYYNFADAALAHRNREFAESVGVGYVPLFEALLKAEGQGRATRWSCDGHLNRLGNEIFAESMYEWLEREARGADIAGGEREDGRYDGDRARLNASGEGIMAFQERGARLAQGPGPRGAARGPGQAGHLRPRHPLYDPPRGPVRSPRQQMPPPVFTRAGMPSSKASPARARS